MADYSRPYSRRKRFSNKPKDIPSLKVLISTFIKDRKLEAVIERIEVLDSWNKLVGDNISKVSKAVRLENKILFVKIINSSWRSELFMFQKEIIIKFNVHFKKRVIDKIMFI